jgi:hypothetical protein
MSERRHDADRHGMHTGVVLGVLAGLAIVIVVAAAAVRGLVGWWDAPPGGPNEAFEMRIAGPQLETAPQYERARYFAGKDRLLHRYEWVDRARGVARIPIEDAMRLVASGRNAAAAGPQEVGR